MTKNCLPLLIATIANYFHNNLIIMNSLIKIFKDLNTYNTGIYYIMYAHQADNYTVYYDTLDNNFSKKEMPIKRKVLYYSCLLISFYPAIQVLHSGLQPRAMGTSDVGRRHLLIPVSIFKN